MPTTPSSSTSSLLSVNSITTIRLLSRLPRHVISRRQSWPTAVCPIPALPPTLTVSTATTATRTASTPAYCGLRLTASCRKSSQARTRASSASWLKNVQMCKLHSFSTRQEPIPVRTGGARGEGCALSYAAGKERQKVPKGRRITDRGNAPCIAHYNNKPRRGGRIRW